jgi:hypothetical protein
VWCLLQHLQNQTRSGDGCSGAVDQIRWMTHALRAIAAQIQRARWGFWVPFAGRRK